MILNKIIDKSSLIGFGYLLFGGKLFVEVVQIKRGWRQILDAWEKNGGLELGHWSFKLGRDEGKGFMFNTKCSI